MTVTPAQLKHLRRHNGKPLRFLGVRGRQEFAWHKMMKAMVAKGLVQPNPYDEYEVTEAGLALIQQMQGD